MRRRQTPAGDEERQPAPVERGRPPGPNGARTVTPPRWKVMADDRPASCLLVRSISPRTCDRRQCSSSRQDDPSNRLQWFY